MAGRIPQAFIDDLLNRVDIVDIIDERVPLKKSGNNHKGLCPFHNEKSPSFTVNQDKQFYHCFGCGANGSALGFMMEYDNLGFVDAVHELASRVGMEVPSEAGGQPVEQHNADYDLLAQVSTYYKQQLREHNNAQQAVNYLKERGLSGEIAAEFDLGYAPPGWDNLLTALGKTPQSKQALFDTGMLIEKEQGGYYDRFRERIMFPIRDQRGRMIGFGGRIMGSGEPKYLNSPETAVFHKGRELYGLYQAKNAIRDQKQILVVEGYMDVLSLAQFGLRNAVATLGTATTRDHLERLFRICPEILFCFDGDNAGRKAAWRALEISLPLLQDGKSIGFLFMPEGEDPDTQIRKQGAEAFIAVDNVTPLSDFLFNSLLTQVNMNSEEGRSKLVTLAKPLINQLPDGAYRALLLKRLAELSSLQQHTLSDMIPAAMAEQRRRPMRPQSTAGNQYSLVRTAIKLLLSRPSLAKLSESTTALRDIELPGAELLADMIDYIHAHPDTHYGALIEHWRDTPNGRHLAKLASMDDLDLIDGAEQEFKATMLKLANKQNEKRLAILKNRRPQELSADEKRELNQLLSHRSPK